MFERMNRRLEALQKQIDAEKERQAQPTTGLTTTTAVERHHAKREEERKMADFQDTDPASGVPVCTPALQRLDPRQDGDRYFDANGQELQRPTTNDEWQKVSAILRTKWVKAA
jgi:hypothetical protein